MTNPFDAIDARLCNIESLLIDIKHRNVHAGQPDNIPGLAAPPFVSKREAARLISVCQSSIDGYARKGHLKRLYVGKKVVFERSEVLALAKSHTNLKK